MTRQLVIVDETRVIVREGAQERVVVRGVGAIGPKGDQGIQGIQGPQGPPGPPGAIHVGVNPPADTSLVWINPT